MSSDPVLQKAKKRVKAKKGFYEHLVSFISVGIFFFLVNLLSFKTNWWFFWPMLPWLIGLLIHYFTIFGIPGTDILTEGWQERELEREVRAILQKQHQVKKAVSESQTELPPPKDEELKLPDLEKTPEKRWSDRDFV